MANIDKIMAALGGFGAGYQGQGAQYLQGIENQKLMAQEQDLRTQQLDERRKAAMVQDAWTVNQLLDQGKAPVALKLLDNRIENIQKLKGDPSDTIAIRDALVSGDPARVAQAKQELQMFSEAGIAAGAWAPPQPKTQEGFTLSEGQKRFDAQGKEIASVAKNIDSSAPQWRPDSINTAQGIFVFDPVSKRYSRATDESGNPLTAFNADPMAQASVEAAKTAGGKQAERRDLFKTQGLAAAENLPTLTRALELQKQISTGGAASNIKGLQNYLGVASADAGELNSLFAQNILGQLKSTFGGNPTEGEREALAQAQSSFAQTGKINERLLGNAIKLANERIQRGKRAAQADKDNGTLAEFDSLGKLSFGDKPQNKKTGGVLHVDAQGNKAMVYPDGSYEEVQ